MKAAPIAMAFLMALSSSVYAQEAANTSDQPVTRKEMRMERRSEKASEMPDQKSGEMRRGRRGRKNFEKSRPRKEMHQGKGKPFQNLAEELSLTEEQKAEYRKIHQKGREQIKPLMEKIQKIRQENLEAFEKILTPEQLAKFSKMKALKKGVPFGKKGKGKKHHKPVAE